MSSSFETVHADPFNCPGCGAHDFGLNKPKCPHCGHTSREWLVIERTRGKGVFASEEDRDAKGYFPRDTAEKMFGCDLSGTYFFSAEQSAAMRAHNEWRDDEP